MLSGTERVKRWRKLHPQREKERRTELKKAILAYYGYGKPACVICGENRLACLSIDHINGKGGKHRKLLKCRGNNFYNWLQKNNYPEGFQTLCMNCNWVKRFERNEHS